MKLGERIFISLISIFTLIILIKSYSLPASADFSIGPGFLPRYISYMMLFVAAVLLIKGISIKKVNKESSEEEGNGNIKRMLYSLFLLIATVSIMPFIGMLIPLLAYMLIDYIFIEKIKPLASIRVSVISLVIFFLIFKVWLGVPIPVFAF